MLPIPDWCNNLVPGDAGDTDVFREHRNAALYASSVKAVAGCQDKGSRPLETLAPIVLPSPLRLPSACQVFHYGLLNIDASVEGSARSTLTETMTTGVASR